MWPMPLIPLTTAVGTLQVLRVSSYSHFLALAAYFVHRRPSIPPVFPLTFSGEVPSTVRSVPDFCLFPQFGSFEKLDAALQPPPDF